MKMKRVRPELHTDHPVERFERELALSKKVKMHVIAAVECRHSNFEML